MLAIWGGVGAACCWATATLCSSRSSRTIGAAPVLAWVMLVGFVLVAPFAIAAGAPSSGSLGWLAVVGAANVIGLLLEYQGLRHGKVGVVVAITSTEGAFAAVLAALAGEPVPWVTGLALAVIAVGVALAALEADPDALERRTAPAVPYAVGAALTFGVGLFAAGRISGDLPLAWVVIPARVLGVVFLVLPLAAVRRLPLTRRVAPLVAASGVMEVAGFVCFVLAARSSIAIASVLGSQFAALSAVGAFLVFGERLRRIQVAGIVAIVVGVATLALVQA